MARRFAVLILRPLPAPLRIESCDTAGVKRRAGDDAFRRFSEILEGAKVACSARFASHALCFKNLASCSHAAAHGIAAALIEHGKAAACQGRVPATVTKGRIA